MLEELIAGAVRGLVKGIEDAVATSGQDEAGALAKLRTTLASELARIDGRVAQLAAARAQADADIAAAGPQGAGS